MKKAIMLSSSSTLMLPFPSSSKRLNICTNNIITSMMMAASLTLMMVMMVNQCNGQWWWCRWRCWWRWWPGQGCPRSCRHRKGREASQLCAELDFEQIVMIVKPVKYISLNVFIADNCQVDDFFGHKYFGFICLWWWLSGWCPFLGPNILLNLIGMPFGIVFTRSLHLIALITVKEKMNIKSACIPETLKRWWGVGKGSSWPNTLRRNLRPTHRVWRVC